MSGPAAPTLEEADPFDLPDWVGLGATWSSHHHVRGCAEVAGTLASGTGSMACHLLAVDAAYPAPLVPEEWRVRAHGAWRRGQVLLVRRGGELTLAVPGTAFGADDVLEAVARLAKSVGGRPGDFLVSLRP